MLQKRVLKKKVVHATRFMRRKWCINRCCTSIKKNTTTHQTRSCMETARMDNVRYDFSKVTQKCFCAAQLVLRKHFHSTKSVTRLHSLPFVEITHAPSTSNVLVNYSYKKTLQLCRGTGNHSELPPIKQNKRENCLYCNKLIFLNVLQSLKYQCELNTKKSKNCLDFGQTRPKTVLKLWRY